MENKALLGYVFIVKAFPFLSLSVRSSVSSLTSELIPPVPFASRFLNTRTMKETFKSFVELLISVALDADVMTTLERENGKDTSLGLIDIHEKSILICHYGRQVYLVSNFWRP